MALPAEWANDHVAKCDVLFLWDEVDRPAILEQLDFDSTMEDVIYTRGAVIGRVAGGSGFPGATLGIEAPPPSRTAIRDYCAQRPGASDTPQRTSA